MFSTIFTFRGYNMYALMLQQLYNWHVNWDFMTNWCPFHKLCKVTIRMALISAKRRLERFEWLPATVHEVELQRLNDMCDKPMAPCHCKEKFPYAREVWTPPLPSEARAKKSEAWACRWCEQTKEFPPTYCFVREMLQQYMEHMHLVDSNHRVVTSGPFETRKCARGRLFRWLRRLWDRAAREALRARLWKNEDMVEKILMS